MLVFLSFIFSQTQYTGEYIVLIMIMHGHVVNGQRIVVGEHVVYFFQLRFQFSALDLAPSGNVLPKVHGLCSLCFLSILINSV